MNKKRLEDALPGEFPEQTKFVGRKVIVRLKYSPYKEIEAEVVRDDKDNSGFMIFHLNDNRYLTGAEVDNYRQITEVPETVEEKT